MLQTCFFAISGVLEREQAIERIKASIEKTYGRRGAEVVRAQPGARSTARWRASTRSSCPTEVTSDPRAPRLVPGRRARVRAHRDRGDDGRPRRRAAGERAAGRRHLPERHDARTRSATSRSWSRSGTPTLCIQCGNCSFVCPHSVIRSRYYEPTRLEGAPPSFQSAPLNAPGLPGHRATRCRSTSRTAPAAGCASRRARSRRGGDPVHKAINLAAREPLVEAERENIAFFEALPGERPLARRLRHRARHAVPRAAVRVLRRLRRLRRDAVPEAPLAAVRRPADGRQRDRLLVDLRRQPADHAVDGRRRRARPGVVELAVRGQRRVRARASGSPPTATPSSRAAACPELRDDGGGRARRRDPRRAAAAGVRAARAARAGRRARAAARRARRARRSTDLRSVLDHLRAPQRVDRRRRRLGVRHRLRRPRPRAGERAATSTCSCSTPRSTPTPAVRRRRRRRSARSRSSPPRARRSPTKDLALQAIALRRRLRRPGRDGRRSRSRRCSRSARPRPTTGRRWSSPTATASRTATTCATGSTSSTAPCERPLAADPLRPGGASGRRQPVPARLAAAADAARRLPQGRAALPRARQRRPGRGRAPARASRSRRPTSAGRPTRRWPRAARSEFPPTPARTADGPLDHLHGPRRCATRSSRRRRRCRTPSTASSGWRTAASARSSCSRCSRSSCASEAARNARLVDGPPRASPRRSTTSPPSIDEDPGPRRYLSLLERAAAAVDVPVIASLNGVTPEGWTDYARAMQDAGAAAIELNIYYLPGDPRHHRARRRAAPRRRAASASRRRSPCRSRSS